MDSPSRYLTTRELAEYLRLQPRTVQRWARAGLLPTVRLSRRALRFELTSVLDAIRAARPATARTAQKGGPR